jgi:hypothetical protein
MFARGLFSFQPARLPTYPENLPSPILPTHACPSRKSNYSRTYRTPRGGGYTGSLVGPIRRALSTETPLSALFNFRHLRTLSFSVAHPISWLPSAFRTLSQKTGGVYPLSGHTRCSQADRTCNTRPPRKAAATRELFHESTVTDHQILPLLPIPPQPPSSPFTAHSQSCYRTFTHLSLWLVTMLPGPGSHTYTMSTAISPRTVHFYQCDPLREILS